MNCAGFSRRSAAGFTYVALLLAVALLGTVLAWTGQSWQLAQQREKERQLLFAGNQIRQALMSYAAAGAVMGQYPKSLDELLLDKRQPVVRRHLRRIYPDPMTGRPDWELLSTPTGQVVGVSSRSTAAPLRRAGFAPAQESFAKARTYADWKFMALAGAAAAPSKEGEADGAAGEGQDDGDPGVVIVYPSDNPGDTGDGAFEAPSGDSDSGGGSDSLILDSPRR